MAAACDVAVVPGAGVLAGTLGDWAREAMLQTQRIANQQRINRAWTFAACPTIFIVI
jgi:hypothetical protein